jgi:urease subunit gamma/beta
MHPDETAGSTNRTLIDALVPGCRTAVTVRGQPTSLPGVALTPTEVDRVLLHATARMAWDRRGRGLRLNLPEATAVVASAVVEAARDGATWAEARAAGLRALGPDDVMPGVADLLDVVHVEAVFDDGSRLVSVERPIDGTLGDRAPGAVLPGSRRGPDGAHPAAAPPAADRVEISVVNEAEVPITVSSHFHFFETNPRLCFDRAAAYGRRLAVAAGHSVTFEPGSVTSVELVPIGGDRVVIGFAGLVDGPLDAPGALDAALAKARACGYADTAVRADSGSEQVGDA